MGSLSRLVKKQHRLEAAKSVYTAELLEPDCRRVIDINSARAAGVISHDETSLAGPGRASKAFSPADTGNRTLGHLNSISLAERRSLDPKSPAAGSRDPC